MRYWSADTAHCARAMPGFEGLGKIGAVFTCVGLLKSDSRTVNLLYWYVFGVGGLFQCRKSAGKVGMHDTIIPQLISSVLESY